jgi:pimeloyl-ACP methyl ester carboxylesterase
MSPRLRNLLIVLAVAAALLVFGPFLVPVPPLTGLVLPQALAEPDSEFVEVNGLSVHVKRLGQGEPVLVLLHGFTASTFTWREVMGPLAEHGTVIAFDRPGFGLTERALPGEWAGQSPYTPEAATDLVIGMLDHYGVERATLVGNSAGGALAAYTALRYPERAEALVLADAPLFSVGGGSPPFLLPLFNSPQARHLGPLVSRAFIGNLPDFVRGFWHDKAKVTPDIIEGYQKPFRVENWDRAFWEVFANSRALELGGRLDELTLPVLVVTGANDVTVPAEQSERLARELPNAEYAALTNCGHLPQEECPVPFVQTVVAFLQR